MKTYRAEILGQVPNGLTHNDVFATVNSMLRDRVPVQSITKRRLAGNMVSVVVVIQAPSATSAVSEIVYAANSVFNFSYDVISPREVK